MMPLNRIPLNTGGEKYVPVLLDQIRTWGPLADGKGQATELHLEMVAKNYPHPVVLQIPRAMVGDVLAAIQKVRNAEWPLDAGKDVGP